MRATGCITLMAMAAVLASLPVQAQTPSPSTVPSPSPQGIAQRSFVALDAVNKETRQSQDGALRKCRANMEQALSAERLGAPDMAAKYWEVAARSCRADAQLACRQHKTAAPGECAAVDL